MVCSFILFVPLIKLNSESYSVMSILKLNQLPMISGDIIFTVIFCPIQTFWFNGFYHFSQQKQWHLPWRRNWAPCWIRDQPWKVKNLLLAHNSHIVKDKCIKQMFYDPKCKTFIARVLYRYSNIFFKFWAI